LSPDVIQKNINAQTALNAQQAATATRAAQEELASAFGQGSPLAKEIEARNQMAANMASSDYARQHREEAAKLNAEQSVKGAMSEIAAQQQYENTRMEGERLIMQGRIAEGQNRIQAAELGLAADRNRIAAEQARAQIMLEGWRNWDIGDIARQGLVADYNQFVNQLGFQGAQWQAELAKQNWQAQLQAQREASDQWFKQNALQMQLAELQAPYLSQQNAATALIGASTPARMTNELAGTPWIPGGMYTPFAGI
jgi:hypothetical protein